MSSSSEEDIKKKTHEEEEDNKCNPTRTRQENIHPPYYYHNHHHRNKQKEEKEMGVWGILLFGLIGATATTLAARCKLDTHDRLRSKLRYTSVGHMRQMADWFTSQVTRSQTWKSASGRNFRSSFQEESWKRYNRRMQEEYEEEMERVERIRRMQSVFNREKNKQRRGYESWKENNGTGGGGYHQHFQREDWYWKTNTSQGNKSNYRETRRAPVNYSLSHHYAILGLSRSRATPYTDDEIKTAFRSKAKEFHPDQNLENKDVAEARFKEVMSSYEAIKSERKNMK